MYLFQNNSKHRCRCCTSTNSDVIRYAGLMKLFGIIFVGATLTQFHKVTVDFEVEIFRECSFRKLINETVQ